MYRHILKCEFTENGGEGVQPTGEIAGHRPRELDRRANGDVGEQAARRPDGEAVHLLRIGARDGRPRHRVRHRVEQAEHVARSKRMYSSGRSSTAW